MKCPKCSDEMEQKYWLGSIERRKSFYDEGDMTWLTLWQCLTCKNVEIRKEK